MTEAQKLVAEYVKSGSEAAFCELASRYVNLVFSTALRLVNGDSHRAEDVVQTVFVDLARIARTLPKGVMLGGRLHRHHLPLQIKGESHSVTFFSRLDFIGARAWLNFWREIGKSAFSCKKTVWQSAGIDSRRSRDDHHVERHKSPRLSPHHL